MSVKIRECPECNGPVAGRKDKRFCSNYCRVAFHNSRRDADPSDFLRIRDALLRNRGVLKTLYMKGVRATTVSELKSLQFSFKYFTAVASISRKARLTQYFDFALLTEGEQMRILASPEIHDLISS